MSLEARTRHWSSRAVNREPLPALSSPLECSIDMWIACLVGLTLMTQDRPVTIEKYMTTRWTAEAQQGLAWKEYPRPQLVRKDWLNLNGMWEYAITPKDASQWTGSQGEIRVPYPIQSY